MAPRSTELIGGPPEPLPECLIEVGEIIETGFDRDVRQDGRRDQALVAMW